VTRVLILSESSLAKFSWVAVAESRITAGKQHRLKSTVVKQIS